jgi:hypothetical protein
MKANGSSVLSNTTISFRIAILQGSTAGVPVYTQTLHPTTDSNGQINIVIGGETSFSSIDWSLGQYFLKVELDIKGGTNYQPLSTTQLLSVPYAMYAGAAGSSKDAVTITGDQTITGIKTFSKDLLVNGLTVGRGRNTGVGNAAFGEQALYTNGTGYYNTANGVFALYSNTSGVGNTAAGYNALKVNETGSSNTAIGANTLFLNTGSSNTAIGLDALYLNTTGWANTATGVGALNNNSSGFRNTANGAGALYYNETGWFNPANGESALYTNKDGKQNTAVGFQALLSNVSGFGNTAIGSDAGRSIETGNNNVFLGSSAGEFETGSNRLYIDNQSRGNITDARNKALLYGVFDSDPANQVLTINGTLRIRNQPVNDQDAATKSYVDNKTGGSSATHYVGEEYGGGIVFFVYDNGQHGLIAAKEDNFYVPSGTWWYAGTYMKTMAIANGVGAGRANTLLIYTVQAEGSYSAKYAARACYQFFAEADGVTYGDWYLPSPFELNELYLQKSVVGGFTNNKYWSSYENSVNNATSQSFDDGSWHYDDKSDQNYVRPIRSF